MSSSFKGLHGAALKIPSISSKIDGHTGIDKSLIIPHDKDPSIEDVKEFMKKLVMPAYIDQFWDCEDMAFYAIAKARCRYPCMPMGIAVGVIKDTTENHALVILWDKNFSRAEYYDPQRKDTMDFNAKVIIPFPCHGKRSAGNIPGTGALSFLDKGGAFCFDSYYDFSSEKIVKAKEFLKKGGLEECEEKTMKECCPPSVYKKSYSECDRMVSWFINFRKEEDLRGAPIGIAFGRWKDAIDQAYLCFWEDSDQRPSYWSPNARVPKDQETNFKPNIIIV